MRARLAVLAVAAAIAITVWLSMVLMISAAWTNVNRAPELPDTLANTPKYDLSACAHHYSPDGTTDYYICKPGQERVK